MNLFWISLINAAAILIITEMYLKKSTRARWGKYLLAFFAAATFSEVLAITVIGI